MWKGIDEEGEWYLLRANKGHVTPEGQAAPSETQREFLLCKEIKKRQNKETLEIIFLLTDILDTFVRSVGTFTEHFLSLWSTLALAARLSRWVINAWVRPHIWECCFLMKLCMDQPTVLQWSRTPQGEHSIRNGVWLLNRRMTQHTGDSRPSWAVAPPLAAVQKGKATQTLKGWNGPQGWRWSSEGHCQFIPFSGRQ